VERSLISLDVKNCSFAKIHTDLGEQWNEQREIGERLGVAQMTVSNDVNKNCNLAKIVQDLGKQSQTWIPRIAILQKSVKTLASSGTSRYLWIQIIAILQKFVTILPRARGRAEMPVRANWR